MGACGLWRLDAPKLKWFSGENVKQKDWIYEISKIWVQGTSKGTAEVPHTLGGGLNIAKSM